MCVGSFKFHRTRHRRIGEGATAELGRLSHHRHREIKALKSDEKDAAPPPPRGRGAPREEFDERCKILDVRYWGRGPVCSQVVRTPAGPQMALDGSNGLERVHEVQPDPILLLGQRSRSSAA